MAPVTMIGIALALTCCPWPSRRINKGEALPPLNVRFLVLKSSQSVATEAFRKLPHMLPVVSSELQLPTAFYSHIQPPRSTVFELTQHRSFFSAALIHNHLEHRSPSFATERPFFTNVSSQRAWR
jgi:hypothetical protein